MFYCSADIPESPTNHSTHHLGIWLIRFLETTFFLFPCFFLPSCMKAGSPGLDLKFLVVRDIQRPMRASLSLSKQPPGSRRSGAKTQLLLVPAKNSSCCLFAAPNQDRPSCTTAGCGGNDGDVTNGCAKVFRQLLKECWRAAGGDIFFPKKKHVVVFLRQCWTVSHPVRIVQPQPIVPHLTNGITVKAPGWDSEDLGSIFGLVTDCLL